MGNSPKENQVSIAKRCLVGGALVLVFFTGFFVRHYAHIESKDTPRLGPEPIEDEEVQKLYKMGLTILQADSPAEAKEFFQREFDRTGHLQFLFGLSWIEFTQSQYNATEKKAQFIALKTTDDRLKASAEYLLGYLSARKLESAAAYAAYSRALEIRLRQGENQEIIKVYRALADVALSEGDLTKADYYVNKILTYSLEGTYVEAYILHLQERIFLQRNDLLAAEKFCRAALDQFTAEGIQANADMKRLQLAFYRILSDDLKSAATLEQALAEQSLSIPVVHLQRTIT